MKLKQLRADANAWREERTLANLIAYYTQEFAQHWENAHLEPDWQRGQTLKRAREDCDRLAAAIDALEAGDLR